MVVPWALGNSLTHPDTDDVWHDTTAGERPEEVAEQLEQQIADGLFELSAKEQAERERLREEGFKDWTRKDLRALVNALEKHGRGDTVRGYRAVSPARINACIMHPLTPSQSLPALLAG